jgi:alpha-tubulin suppressor-like RCC1 family protein
LIPTELLALRSHNIAKVAVGGSHMAALTDDGRLLTWGLDDCGQCGHVQVEVPTDPKHYKPPIYRGGKAPSFVVGLEGQRVVDVSCGRHFTACVTAEGAVYVWGSGADYVLGNGSRANAKTPVKVAALEGKQLVAVKCGRNFVIALDASGVLYSWGRNGNGQLGQSQQDLYKAEPKAVSFVKDIVQISVGDFHVVALSSSGKVYTWGAGADGQLGHGNRSNQSSPKQIQDLPQIARVSAGGNHTALLTSDWKLLIFGRGREGQLGRGSERESAASYRTTPQDVDFFKKEVLEVVCGAEHTMVLANTQQ